MLRIMITGNGLPPSDLDDEVLRTLMNLQNYRCALSGIRFSLPSTTEFPVGTSINTWRDDIRTTRPVDYYNSPDLVRVSPFAGWVPGNVMLIAHWLYEMYNSGGSTSAFKDATSFLSTRRVVVVPAEQLIKLGIPEVEAQEPTPAQAPEVLEAVHPDDSEDRDSPIPVRYAYTDGATP